MWRDRLEQGRAALDRVEPDDDLWNRALEKAATPTASQSTGARRAPRVLVAAAVFTLGTVGFLVVLANDDDGRVRTTPPAVDPAEDPREPGDGGDTPSTTPTSTRSEQHGQPAASVQGQPVRGADVPLVIEGLQQLQGQPVELRVETDGPVPTVSGGDKVGYASLGSAVVDDSGSLSATVTIPNSLSGEDDIIPLVPGARYLLIVDSADDQIEMAFTVEEASLDQPYSVAARRGSPECGGPPVEIGFDGRQWSSEDLAVLPGSEEQVAGTFTLISEQSGRFERPGHPPVTFSAALTGWSC
jgi:hypothetical protein